MAPQIVTRLSEPLVTGKLFPRSGAAATDSYKHFRSLVTAPLAPQTWRATASDTSLIATLARAYSVAPHLRTVGMWRRCYSLWRSLCQYNESLNSDTKMFITENEGRPAVQDCRSTLFSDKVEKTRCHQIQQPISHIPAFNLEGNLATMWASFFFVFNHSRNNNFLFKLHFKIGANRGNECLPLKRAGAPQKAQGKCVSYSDAPLFTTPQTRFWKRPHMLTSVTTNGAWPGPVLLRYWPCQPFIIQINTLLTLFLFSGF